MFSPFILITPEYLRPAHPMDLPTFDQLCQCAYSQTQGPARQEAEGRLMMLTQNADAFRFIASSLESPSISSATMHFALTSLTKILTQFWVAVPPTDRLAARSAVLAFLRVRGADAEVHIVNQTCLFLARVSKMGWFDSAPSDPSMLPFHSMSVSSLSSPTAAAAPAPQMPFQDMVPTPPPPQHNPLPLIPPLPPPGL